MDMQKAIGKTLKAKRLQKGETQREVAENTGMSRSYIADLEAGRYMPSVKVLVILASYFNISFDFLLKMSGKHVNNKRGA